MDSKPENAADSPSGSGDVVVTGSRVISNGNNSPTPLTTVSTEKLVQTTPSNIPDALNKLPAFALSGNVRTISNSSANGTGNFLNLRGFGAIRTLILLDGVRVPPTAANGQVDVNTIPQALVQRVDVVTGGASAVYGSDAVTGVVNFVLDKKFKGLKAFAQAGVSTFGDDPSYRIGLAAGTFLTDRLHVEASFEHYYSAGIQNKLDRPLGQYGYTETGAGTAANPFHLNINSRLPLSYSPGGYLSIAKGKNAGPGALYGDYTFTSNGVLAPFTHGLPSGSSGTESGGDGGWGNMGYSPQADTWLTSKLRTEQAFGRVDYEVSSNVRAYVQGSFAESENYVVFYPLWFSGTILATNPYLSPAMQQGLAANGTDRFTYSRSLPYEQGSGAAGLTRNFTVTAGLEGDLNRFHWNANYTHGDSRLHETDPVNINYEKLFAALDSTVDPATNQIVCRVALTAPGRYPGCQPFNPFGPHSETAGTFQYWDQPSDFRLTNLLDDFSASIAGRAFNNWAGPVNVAISGEYRQFSLDIKSDYHPTDLVNCTYLNPQICPGLNANGTAPLNPATQTPPLWALNVVNPAHASENVAEVAGEVDFPLLHDVRFFRALDLNGAVRYTHYSVTGSATTWKAGLTWQISDELKLRGTRSRDIRAPTLQDLFNPIQAGISSYTDLLTGVSSANEIIQSQGNSTLKPEVANTLTAGFVYKPHWLSGLSIAADYYNIKINNAITTLSGSDATIQRTCLASGGTSPFCSFFIRPINQTDTSAANFPTKVLSQPFNVAKTSTYGVDGEMNYHTGFPGFSNEPGALDLRFLISWQPELLQQNLPGAVITDAAGAAGLAEWRLAFNATYTTGPVRFGVEERWHSSEVPNSNPTLVFTDPDVPAAAYTDINMAVKFGHGSGQAKPFEAFLAVENLLNRQPDVFIGTGLAGAPGYAYPASRDQDVVGRYFTAGVRVRL